MTVTLLSCTPLTLTLRPYQSRRPEVVPGPRRAVESETPVFLDSLSCEQESIPLRTLSKMGSFRETGLRSWDRYDTISRTE